MPETINLDNSNLDAPVRKVANPDGPTEKQLTFARNLYREIADLGSRYFKADAENSDEMAEEYHLTWRETVLEGLGEEGASIKVTGTRKEFSSYIDRLIKQRDGLRQKVRDRERASRQANPQSPGVPAGRYAITEDDKTTFVKVDRPDFGKWAGYVFVKRLVASPGQLVEYPIRDREHRARILATIEADGPDAASRRFGQEIGRCGVCGSPLTNESSRQAGIGPVCAAKFG